MTSTTMFALFPYLYTSAPLMVRDVEFRSAADIGLLSEAGRDELRALARLFYMRGDKRISAERITYAWFPLEQGDEAMLEWLRRVQEAQDLLAYMYAVPSDTGNAIIPFEQADLYIFSSQDGARHRLVHSNFGIEGAVTGPLRDRPTEADLNGYSTWRNFGTRFIATSETRLYPGLANLLLHEAQDLAVDLARFLDEAENWAWRPFMLGESEPVLTLKQRVGTAIHWYNLACSGTVMALEEIVRLTIALETLLGLPNEGKVTDRLKQAVMTLIGPVPRLDSWLDQFYSARSEVVHSGWSDHLMYYAAEAGSLRDIRKGTMSAAQYRTLAVHGRIVFRLCLNTILSGATAASMSGLESKLFRTEELLEKICTCLNRADHPPDAQITQAHQYIRLLDPEYWRSDEKVPYATLAAAGRLLLQTYLLADKELLDDIRDAMVELVETGRELSEEETLYRYVGLHLKFSGRPSRMSEHGTSGPVTVADIVAQFLAFAGHRTQAMLYEQREGV